MNFELLLKDYTYWAVLLNLNQCYLGRMVIVSKTSPTLDFSELSFDETENLFTVLKDVKTALYRCFQPDRINYSVLCNVNHELHMHVIPRYREARLFGGHLFRDDQWGKNYSPYDHGYKVDSNIILSISKALSECM